jgi:hypothetical protein
VEIDVGCITFRFEGGWKKLVGGLSVCLSVCLSVVWVWFGLVCGLVGWSSLRSADRLIGRRGKRGLLTAPRPGDASRTHLRALP